MNNKRLFICFILCALAIHARGQIITTIAGNGAIGYSGDGGPAIAARLNFPAGIAVDGASNLYIADANNNRIRKVNTSGIITTVAGDGVSGISGDGGPATLASLYVAEWIAVDVPGNIYIVTGYGIRKVNIAGIITTFAGGGARAFTDGEPATAISMDGSGSVAVDGVGNVYVGDGSKIIKINSSGFVSAVAGTDSTGFRGDGGPATAAELAVSSYITADSVGNIYIDDIFNYRVRKVNTSGIITTIAGNGISGYDGDGGPATAAELSGAEIGIASDNSGNVYITDGYRVRKISTSGIISTVIGNGTEGNSGDGGPATAAEISGGAIAVSPSGSIYLSDGGNMRIRKVTNNFHIPHFTGGDSQVFAVCENSGLGSINSLLSVTDTNTMLPLTWSAITLPAHGTVAAAYDAEANGGIVTPSGLSYIPTGGYSGSDSFRVRATDGIGSDTTTIHVTVNPLPAITGASSVCEGATATLHNSIPGGTWSSPWDYSGVATIASGTGVVTGVNLGTAAITYTLATGCYTTDTITVVFSPSVISGASSVCTGSEIALGDEVVGGIWSSSETGVATVHSGIFGAVTGVSVGTAVITYSLGTGCFVTKTITVNPLPAAITGTMHVCAGNETTLSDATSGGAWSISGSGVAGTGSGTGIITGVSAGTAIITYTSGLGCIATTTFTVNPLPAIIEGNMAVCAGATGVLTDSTSGGTWSGGGSIATISSSGTVTGILAGTGTVTYTLGTGCRATAVVAVNPLPTTIFGVMHLCAGNTTTLYDSTGGGSWSTLESGVAGIGSGTGVVTGVSAGTAIVSYMAGGCYTHTTVTVNAVPGTIGGASNGCAGLTSLLTDVTPGGTWHSNDTAIATVGTGTGILTGITGGAVAITYTLSTGCYATTGLTVNATPTAITGTGMVCNGSSVTLSDSVSGGAWSTSGSGVTSVSSGTGVVTGVSAGTAMISYAIGGCAAMRVILVNPTPASITGADSLCEAGATTHLYDATPHGLWTSTLVTVDTTGVVTGFISGVGIVTYTLGTGCFMTKTINVLPLPAEITGEDFVCLDSAIALSDASSGGMWSSVGSGAYAALGSTGILTGIATGTAIVTYTIPTGCFSTKIITVNPVPLPVTGAASVCAGSTITLGDSTVGGVWSTSGSGVASAGSGTGVVTGISEGAAVITYTVARLCGSMVTKSIIVNPMPDAGNISGPGSVCTGSQVTLSDPVTGGVWGTNNITATIADGLVNGITAGIDTISYSVTNMCGTATATYPITINSFPDAGAITGADSLCPGDTATLADAITGGAWSSSNANATVSNTGQVTASIAGTDTVNYTVTNECGVATASFPFVVKSSEECVNEVAPPRPSPEGRALYPNPARERFTIEGASGADMAMYNILGEQVNKVFISSDKQTVDISSLPDGVYVVELTGIDGTREVRRVVKAE